MACDKTTMTKEEILRHVDHTLLKATASFEEIMKLCEEAITYRTASVCIPPSYVGRVNDRYNDAVNICTVVGFPLGYQVTESKVTETEKAIRDGAGEIDMVINIGDVKNGDYNGVAAEIRALRAASEGKILKVIIETCYLTTEEKIRLCEIVTKEGADFIKTSTGFGNAGAQMEDILLFKEHIGPDVRMKASGGIRTIEDMEAFLNAGCDRLGTSSAVALLTAERRLI